MEIKSIRFVFENCDFVIIDGKYIGMFKAANIRHSIARTACNYFDEYDTVSEFAIEVHKDADKKYKPFGCLEETSTFDRLRQYMDITQIDINIIDDNCETKTVKLWADWIGDDEYTNEAQHVYTSKPGNLYITIAKDKDIGDFFNQDKINDQHHVDFCFDMMKVGDKYMESGD